MKPRGLTLRLCRERAPLELAASSCCDQHEGSDFMHVHSSLAATDPENNSNPQSVKPSPLPTMRICPAGSAVVR